MRRPWGLGLLLLTSLLLASIPASAADPAPDFEIFDLDGYPVRRSDYTSQGKPVLLDFMATWCTSCHVTIKEIKKVYPEYQDRLSIVSISYDSAESTEDLRGYKSQYGMTWPLAKDTDNVVQKYSVVAISYLVAINAKGYVVWTGLGEVFEPALREGFDLATRPDAKPIDVAQVGVFAMAVLAGAASFFSPCAFPMLPGYATYYLGLDAKRAAASVAGAAAATTGVAGAASSAPVSSGRREAIRRGVLCGGTAAMGLLSIYAVFGIAVVLLAGSITRFIPHLGLIVGIVLIALAVLLLSGISMMRVFGPLASRIQGSPGPGVGSPVDAQGPAAGMPLRRLFLYGAGYGLAACGCVLPVVVGMFILGVNAGPVVGLAVVLLFAGTAAALMISITVGISMAGPQAARKLNRYMPWINRVCAVAMVAVGVYLIAFWYLAWGS